MVTRSKKWSPLKKKLFEKISIKMVTKFLILMKPGQTSAVKKLAPWTLPLTLKFCCFHSSCIFFRLLNLLPGGAIQIFACCVCTLLDQATTIAICQQQRMTRYGFQSEHNGK